MTDLPAGLADPLHILEPTAIPWPALLLGLLGFWLFWRWWRRRQSAPAPVASRATLPPKPEPRDLNGLLKTVNAIRDNTLAIGDYRRGCHDLASALRAHQEERSGQPFTRLTAREILARGETAIGHFFDLLGDLQFSLMPPSRSDFEGIVSMAKDVFVHKPLKKGRR